MNPETNIIYCGDCLEVLKGWPDNCVDSIVTDPPAGISFMGKEWDTFDKTMFGKKGQEGENDLKVKKNFEILPRYGNADLQGFQDFICAVFVQAIRVLKPGGHALVWSIPRTSHHTAMGLEWAGFEIRDCVYHIFGSGFPKSLDISKAIDKAAGAEREVTGRRYAADGTPAAGRKNTVCGDGWKRPWRDKPLEEQGQAWQTAPSTLEAKRWEGWGTAIKPAVECWWLARKPLSEKTVAENVLKWGTGGLNIDGCRIKTEDDLNGDSYSKGEYDMGGKIYALGLKRQEGKYKQPQGRFPANLIHDGSAEVLAGFPDVTCGGSPRAGILRKQKNVYGKLGFTVTPQSSIGPSAGSAARFFYCPKASRAEREAGLEEVKNLFEEMEAMPGRNNHPTVKPVALMRYLIRLITPPGGLVLDMFAGSGSTLVAAKEEGFTFLGIEISPEYVEIARRRVDAIPTMEPRRTRRARRQ